MIKKAILLGYKEGAGKTYLAIRVIERLAKEGKRILIAVPTHKLAMQVYKPELEKVGIKPFILASHKSTFNPEKKSERLADFDCLYYDEIQDLNKIGVSSTTYKEEFCKNCPFLNNCYYPGQYKEVMEPQHNVVIIQHAHFSCQEVILELMKKRFDVLFIDESFIESIYKQIDVPTAHIDLLNSFGYNWTDSLSDWLTGLLDPQGQLDPPADELKHVKEEFEKASEKYVVPDYIRFYNQDRFVNNNKRIEVVYELPQIPLLIMTDATPPLDLIKHLTGIKEIEVFGLNQSIDIKQIHPDNEIIQVLDYSSGAKRLDKDQELFPILDKIADLVSGLRDDQKCVITAYLKDHKRIENYLVENHPTEWKKITLTQISKGINTFATYDMQIILASRFLLGRDYLMQTYIYKQVANFYRKRNGESALANSFPKDLSAEVQVKGNWLPVRRIHKTPKGEGGIYEYPDFKVKIPVKTDNIFDDQYWYKLIYDYAVGEIQQAIRLRWTPDKPRTVYVLTNLSLPTTIVTQSTDFNRWLNGSN